ncbi:hypothetical protein KW807_01320, partial [Candidatus Parcubacteria bacterium]|nr:hypothetical protein [Candidatus Parcubacteria bacterium]
YQKFVQTAENSNKEETQGAKGDLVLIIAVLLIGIISILSVIGFWRNKKWSAIGFFILTILVLVYTIFEASMSGWFSNGLSRALFLLMPWVTLGWLILETRYIKQHWGEFKWL